MELEDTKIYVFMPLPKRTGLAILIFIDEKSLVHYMKKFERVVTRGRVEYHGDGAKDFWDFLSLNNNHKWETIYIDKTDNSHL